MVSGNTYRIQIDGWSSETGSFVLNYLFTPSPPAISIQPSLKFSASGAQGGPFTISNPPSGQYTIQNTGGGTLNWSASGPSWLTFSAPSGSLVANATQAVTVSVTTADAAAATAGTHTGTIAFSSNGGSATRAATLTVNDVTPPTISGTPGSITLNTAADSPTVTHGWTAPTAADNPGGSGVEKFDVALTGAATAGPTPAASLTSYVFPIGVTTVTYTAEDAAGNKATPTSFIVTVLDKVPPAISCPADQTIEATGAAGAMASWTEPTATDNSGSVTVAGSHAPNSEFALGDTTVTYTATDASSNIATCSFVITVEDTTPPQIGATADIVVTAPDLVGATVTFGLPSATDAVTASPTITASLPSGSFFAIGPHTVTITATDTAGNSSTKPFQITVQTPASLAVAPGTGFASAGPQGQQGGAFSLVSQPYTVTNNGDVPMDFTVDGAPSWVDVTPLSDSLAPGASTTVTISLTTAADALPVGTHDGNVTFTNETSGIGTTVRSVQLVVLAPAALAVTPATDFTASGPQGQQGGSFTPPSTSYTLRNTGALPLQFTATNAPAWVTLSPASGTIDPGGAAVVTVALNAGANAVPVGTATGTIDFNNQTNGIGNTSRGVTLNVLEPARLSVGQADGLVASGYEGGPFSPSSKTYTLSNTGAFSLDFTASADQGWLKVAPTSGTIPANGSASVTLSLDASASTLTSGSYTGTLTITNSTSGLGSATRPATLSVIPNGQLILKVVTSEGDGTFAFDSSTSALALSLTTSGGMAQSAPITLNPGTYQVTAKPPDGFGLTAVSCSDSDSAGDAGARSASIVLASAETVTCTFSSANSRKRTVEVIGAFMSRRADLLLSTGPDPRRQVDRLVEAQEGSRSPGDGFAGFADDRLGSAPAATKPAGASHLGAASPMLDGIGSSGRGLSAAGRDRSAASTFEQRLAEMGGSALTPFLDDPVEDQGGLSPFRLSGNNVGGTRLSFSTSLSQFRKFWQDSEKQRVEKLVTTSGLSPSALPTPAAKLSPFDIWVEGHYAAFSDDRDSKDSDGHFGVVYVGADYVVAPWLLVGALAQYDTMKMSSAWDSYAIEGDGWMAGPYATVRLSENLFLQGRAAWGTTDNLVRPFLTYTDSFETERWLVSSTLTGRWQLGAWEVRPAATLAYIEDQSKAYTDSLDVRIPGITVSLGQLKAGPEISRRFELSDTAMLEPRLGAELIWNFDSSSEVANFGGTMAGGEGVRGNVWLGLRAHMPAGVWLDLSGGYDGVGSSSYEAFTGKATVRMSF